MPPRVLALLALLTAAPAAARSAGDPITLTWREGDVAGFSRILAPGAERTLGAVEFHQRREGDLLHMERVARFADGSSDIDVVTARVGTTLVTLRGRSEIRGTDGRPVVALDIDVAGGRIRGSGRDGDRWDEREALPPGTYFGPLLFLVLKNFDANADGDRVVFRTVAPTPAPRVLDMALVRLGPTTVPRAGGRVSVQRFALRPTVNVLIDPLLRLIAPTTEFLVRPGEPPALARFAGPRNYAGQEIWLE